MSFTPRPEWLEPQVLERAHALPAPFFTEPAALQLEQRLVFARSWQLVGHVESLSGVGHHVVGDIGAVPILVVRGDDGELRAFHNVCRHRAGPIATCDGRGAKALRCKYHGWTYDLRGRLRGAPEMEGALDFDMASIRLPEIAVQVWQGLVFVALDRAPPLPEVLGGIAERLGGRDLTSYSFQARVRYEIACNWKVYVDNFLEGYHVPHIHPALNSLLDYRNYTTEVARWHSLQASPMKGAESVYGEGEALYYFVYPNTMLNILPGRLQTNRVLPLGVDRCRVDFDYFYPREDGEAQRDRRAKDQEFSAAVQQEDVDICLAVQRRLASGSYVAGRLCPKRENGVHHFHELLRAAWREG